MIIGIISSVVAVFTMVAAYLYFFNQQCPVISNDVMPFRSRSYDIDVLLSGDGVSFTSIQEYAQSGSPIAIIKEKLYFRVRKEGATNIKVKRGAYVKRFSKLKKETDGWFSGNAKFGSGLNELTFEVSIGKQKTIYPLTLSCTLFASVIAQAEEESETPTPIPEEPKPPIDEQSTPTPSEPIKKAKYSVLLYGVAGGNLDSFLSMNLKEAAKAGSNEDVKFAAQFKWSRKYQKYDDFEGTFRDVLEGNTWVTKERFSVDKKMDTASELTDFLEWGKKVVPAEKYILVLWNHGDVWSSHNETAEARRTGRAVLFDDNTGGTSLSTASLAKGITDSSIEIEAIYFDVCLMFMMETIQELSVNAPKVKYVMGAEHLTPGDGGNYKLLVETLKNKFSIEEKFFDYVAGTAESSSWWNNYKIGTPHDLSVIRMKDVPELITAIKGFIDKFIKNKDVAEKAAKQAFNMRYQDLNPETTLESSTDMLDFFYNLYKFSGNTLNAELKSLREAWRKAIVVTGKNKKCKLKEPSIGIFTKRGYIKAWSDNKEWYITTQFDKAVKWSRILDLLA